MVTLREVTGDPEEVAALQRVIERDEGLGFTETGEVRPWRYDKLESESILMDKVLGVTRWRGGCRGPTGGRWGGVR